VPVLVSLLVLEVEVPPLDEVVLPPPPSFVSPSPQPLVEAAIDDATSHESTATERRLRDLGTTKDDGCTDRSVATRPHLSTTRHAPSASRGFRRARSRCAAIALRAKESDVDSSTVCA
jgi:hypothetical protein